MTGLTSLGAEIAQQRRRRALTQTELARRAGISRATLDALENGRAGEIGYSKIARLAAALGLELKLQPTGLTRPTLDELLEENRDDQNLDRRG